MSVFDGIKKATQDVVRGAKDLTDTARQNSLITDEQKKITILYSQIGKLYYETNEADPDTPLGKLCLAINSSNERIAAYQEEIRKIKGTKHCPSCGADINLASSFCGVCGARTEDMVEAMPQSATAKIYCKGCGAELAPGITFCTSCGAKQ